MDFRLWSSGNRKKSSHGTRKSYSRVIVEATLEQLWSSGNNFFIRLNVLGGNVVGFLIAMSPFQDEETKQKLRTPEIPYPRAIGAALLVEVAHIADVAAEYELGLNSGKGLQGSCIVPHQNFKGITTFDYLMKKQSKSFAHLKYHILGQCKAIGAALLVEVAHIADVAAEYELGLNSVSIL
nr:hypothetical protein [Tanacetum cinerariifolium]